MSPLPVNLVHWRQPEWCADAARSVLASDTPVALTIVNNSPELDAELRERLPAGVDVVTCPGNTGYAGAANVALGRWITGDDDLVVVGAHDMNPDPSTLRTMVEAAIAHPEYGVIGPVLRSKESGASSAVAVTDPTRVLNDVDWVSGTCLLLRRGCIDDIGGFDEAYGSYCEDSDLCRRARLAGWKVGLCPAAEVGDLGSGDPVARRVATINYARRDRLHHGVAAGMRQLLRIAWELVVSAVGAIVPTRPADLRRSSLHRVRNNVAALRRIPVVWAQPRTDLDPAAAAALPTYRTEASGSSGP
ncbi:MAG: glycosyltransferase [Acidimicrobiales bacterium]